MPESQAQPPAATNDRAHIERPTMFDLLDKFLTFAETAELPELQTAEDRQPVGLVVVFPNGQHMSAMAEERNRYDSAKALFDLALAQRK